MTTFWIERTDGACEIVEAEYFKTDKNDMLMFYGKYEEPTYSKEGELILGGEVFIAGYNLSKIIGFKAKG